MTDKIATKSPGGRPATGSIVWADPETKTQPVGVRVTRANGRRKVVRFDPGTTRDDAFALAPVIAERARLAVDASTGETAAEYAERWCKWRESRGLGCVRGDRARLRCHVFGVLGAIAIADVTRDDLRRLVSALDAKARAGFYRTNHGKRHPFGWRTAVNVWSIARAMFRDACTAKQVDLRVRDDNPSDGVPGPDLGPRKTKTYLWPSEFAALVSCEEVPLGWRRMFAVTTYLYARAGEVNALRWEDVDLERGVVHVHASVNRDTGARKSTKTGEARRVPIERELVPVLRAMRDEARGRGAVAPVRATDRKFSRQLRRCLALAGVDRAELFVMGDPTLKAITFHDLRATGITWCAVRGDDPLKIKQRAGHSTFSTTEGYIREAENLRDGFGEVFPPLPPSLLDGKPKNRRRVSASVSAFGSVPIAILARNKPFGVEAPRIELGAASNGARRQVSCRHLRPRVGK
jgi:integrase